jgi:hypothetical protein
MRLGRFGPYQDRQVPVVDPEQLIIAADGITTAPVITFINGTITAARDAGIVASGTTRLVLLKTTATCPKHK